MLIKSIYRIFLTFTLVSCFLPTVSAQEDDEGEGFTPSFTFGLGLGFYFPDGKPASFYDGSPENENNVDLIFNNYYYRQEIEQNLGYVLDTVTPYEEPGAMRYTPEFAFTFYFSWPKTKVSGYFVQFTYSKLKAEDAIKLNLHLPQNYSFEPTYRFFPIWGKEDRYMIDLGFTRYYPQNDKLVFFFEPAINMTLVRVAENKMNIEGVDYNLVNEYGSQGYIPGSSQQTYPVIQGGTGWGVSMTGGVKLLFSETISVDPGFTLYMQQVNLGTWDAVRPGYNLFVRLIYPF